MSIWDKIIDILAGLTIIIIIASSLIRGKKHKNKDNKIEETSNNKEVETIESDNSSSSNIM